MRQTQIFSGSSHPLLVKGICDRLGQNPAKAELSKFMNGETSVQLQTSIRDQDVFIVQSGSSKINDNIMELLIMISACKGGSAKSITAVMPYFPYSRQSKKKSHRGAITARMIANLLHVAGVDHVITIDLHASQMQGFFKCPVDNLVAEPLLARWIKQNVKDWKIGVVVSKNPGGTKRVTSLADALKLSFGIVTTDRRRRTIGPGYFSMNGSMVFEAIQTDGSDDADRGDADKEDADSADKEDLDSEDETETEGPREPRPPRHHEASRSNSHRRNHPRRRVNGSTKTASPLIKPFASEGGADGLDEALPRPLGRVSTAPSTFQREDSESEGFTDERARHVITSRLVQGHVVDDDAPSPALSASTTSTARHRKSTDDDDDEAIPDHMLSSFISTASSRRDHGLGGSAEAADSSAEEEEDLKNPEIDTTVTLVGNVKDRPVFIIDDMIDQAGSWIAAAETVVKRAHATKVYCMATHGLFGDDALEEMERCECIEKIIVTNAFPIPLEKASKTRKLVVIGVDNLLAEAIRRNHHGESISQLFMHYD